MNSFQTDLRKMKVELKNGEAQYFLNSQTFEVPVNHWVGKTIHLKYLGKIKCIGCGINIKKSYSQGYCYLCFTRLPQNDICIVKPELCHHHLGTCRDSKWGSNYCFSKHMLYLSLTSEIKVGITKLSHYQTRWIDQGATCGLPVAVLNSRYHSGLLENFLKENQFADKTNWRVLLKENKVLDKRMMMSYRKNINELILEYCDTKNEIDSTSIDFQFDKITQISYPGSLYQKQSVSSINLDKNPEYQGVLIGIKGQYLIFEDAVINLRKYCGYQIEFNLYE